VLQIGNSNDRLAAPTRQFDLELGRTNLFNGPLHFEDHGRVRKTDHEVWDVPVEVDRLVRPGPFDPIEESGVSRFEPAPKPNPLVDRWYPESRHWITCQ
jgi:hypothetical protein